MLVHPMKKTVVTGEVEICPCVYTLTFDATRGIQKVLQLDILDWKTFRNNLYTSKTYFSPLLTRI